MRTVSRRGLLAAGVVVAAGAGAVAVGESDRGRRWLHSAGVLDGPDLAPPGDASAPRVVTETLASSHVPQSVAYAVAAPPVAPGDVEAIVVCLHGRRGDQSFAFSAMGVHRFVAARRLPWAVAALAGGSAYWHTRRDGCAPDAVLFDELLPLLTSRFPGARVLLLGWSMGGYGALLGAARHVDRVVAVAASGAALWRSFGDSAPGAFDSVADFRANDVFADVEVLRRTPVRIDCGDADPFIAMNRALVAALPEAERDFGTGFHDTATWRTRLPTQLDFFERALNA